MYMTRFSGLCGTGRLSEFLSSPWEYTARSPSGERGVRVTPHRTLQKSSWNLASYRRHPLLFGAYALLLSLDLWSTYGKNRPEKQNWHVDLSGYMMPWPYRRQSMHWHCRLQPADLIRPHSPHSTQSFGTRTFQVFDDVAPVVLFGRQDTASFGYTGKS